MEEGQTTSAEASLKQVASSWNGNAASLAKMALADLYHQTGRDQQAIDIYNELTKKPTDSVPAGLAQIQLAELYTAEGKADQAHTIYAQLKDKDAKGAAGIVAAQKLNPAPGGWRGRRPAALDSHLKAVLFIMQVCRDRQGTDVPSRL